MSNDRDGKTSKFRVRPRRRNKADAPVRLPEVPDEHGVVRNVEATKSASTNSAAVEPRKRRPIDEKFRCVRIKKDGYRCGRAAIRGGTVCVKHGGRAIQIQRAATRRLEANSDRAVKVEVEIMADKKIAPAVRLNAAKDILDRTGHVATSRVEVEMPNFLRDLEAATRGFDRSGFSDVDEDATDDTHGPTEAADDIVDAEIVEPVEDDPMPLRQPGANVVNLPVRPRHEVEFSTEQHAMLTQEQIQQGERHDRPVSRAERNRPTEWRP